MSKVEDLTLAGLLIPDPEDATRSILRIDVSVLNDLINDYSALELAAMGRGWVGEDVVDAVNYLIQWPKTIAAEDVKAKLREQVAEQAAEQFDAQIEGMF